MSKYRATEMAVDSLSYAWHTAKRSCYCKLSTSAAAIFTLIAHVEAKTLVPICAPMDVLVSKQGLVSWHVAILRQKKMIVPLTDEKTGLVSDTMFFLLFKRHLFKIVRGTYNGSLHSAC